MSRVVQTHQFLPDVARDVASGIVGIADFQRDYAWTKEDVAAFFRSIMKGWPIGSLMLWRPVAEEMGFAARSRIGPLEVADIPECLVLDGQNRLLSMVWAMHGAPANADVSRYPEAERETWLSGEILVADFPNRDFQWLDPDLAFSEGCVPVGELLKAYIFPTAKVSARERMEMMERSSQIGGDDALQWFHDDFPNAVRSARIATTTLDRMSAEEAREAFLAIARTGQPISENDFERAANWSPNARLT